MFAWNERTNILNKCNFGEADVFLVLSVGWNGMLKKGVFRVLVDVGGWDGAVDWIRIRFHVM